jgi:hypothetical protein
MIRDGQSKRKPGSVFAQLLLSACVLLVPPLLMVAGVMQVAIQSDAALRQSIEPRQMAAATLSDGALLAIL